MLADKHLSPRFNCGKCEARPEGVRRGAAPEQAPPDDIPPATTTTPPPAQERLTLEPGLVEPLLAHALTGGQPLSIHPGILPLKSFSPDDLHQYQVPLAGLLWDAIGESVLTQGAVASWLDRLPLARLARGKDAARQLERNARLAGDLRRWVGEQLVQLMDSLRRRPPLSVQEADDVMARARQLSNRAALMNALQAAVDGVQTPGRDVLEVVAGIHEATAALQKGQADFGAPLDSLAVELLEGLVEAHRPAIATPFETLNEILGGGLQGGKLYVLAAPPGAGKTTLSCQIADYAAASGVPVAYVALEMGRGQLFDYALARAAGVNSSVIEARHFRRSLAETNRLAAAAQDYLARVGPNLAVIEGDDTTTPAKLAAWVTGARARYKLTAEEPVLVVVDYLQLLNSGLEELDSQQNETPRISQVAVQLKQLARRTGAAVLALSDINRAEQNNVTKGNQEFTLSAFRGSNRIGHAADVALVLYSEAACEDGGKASSGPWDLLGDKLKGSPRAVEFLRELENAKFEHTTGGPAAAVHARLELLKHRGGQGRGNQLLIYQRAFHRFIAVTCAGQAAAEGRA
jgi:replicative DNA helicase